jgi:DNA-binding transcriptional LysR family regulator
LFNQELIYNLIIQECLQAGFRPKIAYEISEWGFISEMIGENIGISICPKPIAKKVNQDLIKVISIETPSIPWSLGFISKKRKHASPAVREFIKYISAELPF